MSVDPDGVYTLRVGTAEFGNGTTTVHTQLAATELSTVADRIDVSQSDTDTADFDTGAFGSAGTVVAGQAVLLACRDLRTAMIDAAAELTGASPASCVLGRNGVQCGDRLVDFAALPALTGHGSHDGTPRSVAFNVHAFRVAVNTETGEVLILQRCRPPTPAWCSTRSSAAGRSKVVWPKRSVQRSTRRC